MYLKLGCVLKEIQREGGQNQSADQNKKQSSASKTPTEAAKKGQVCIFVCLNRPLTLSWTEQCRRVCFVLNMFLFDGFLESSSGLWEEEQGSCPAGYWEHVGCSGKKAVSESQAGYQATHSLRLVQFLL